MNKRFKYIIALLTLCLVFTACSQNKNAGNVTENTEIATEDVTKYEGIGKGRNGDIKVAVSVDKDNNITDIEMLEHQEDDGFWDKAIEEIRTKVVEEQTLAVDSVSGATLSSMGIIEATAVALEEAEMDLDKLGYVPPALPEPSELITKTGANVEGVQNFEYKTQGDTCSTKVTFYVKEDDMTVYDIRIEDGCDGNSRGFSAIADGSHIDDIIQRFDGIPCHASDNSSCPDQVAKALNEARFLMLGERLAKNN